jgi:hypothetical protein
MSQLAIKGDMLFFNKPKINATVFRAISPFPSKLNFIYIFKFPDIT